MPEAVEIMIRVLWSCITN